MPAVAAVAIPAAASIVGGVVKAKAANRAYKAQEAAAKEAIAYQERTQKERQARYDAAYQDYRNRYDDYLEQFYGVKKKPAAAEGVHASAAGVGGGGAAAPISASSIAPMVSPVRRGDTIADLMRGIGQIRGNAANASGDIWGDSITQAGAAIGKGFKPQQQEPPLGMFQSTGVAPGAAGIDPNAAMFQTGGGANGWSDWDRYLYSGGV